MTYFFYIHTIGVPLFFLVLTVITGRLEKRMVWQYGEPGPQPPYPDPSRYGERWANGALLSGFRPLGWAADPRTPHYRQNYGFFVSPEGDCLVVVCAGHIFKLKSQSTTIYTATTDGKVYYTTDRLNGMQIDLLGHWMNQLAPVKAFPELLKRHRDLLQDKKAITQLFPPGKEMDEFKRMRSERYGVMARHGLIVYKDRMDTYWHFTLWGALRYTFVNFSIGFVRVLTNGYVFRCV
jgi:hypothetical protein